MRNGIYPLRGPRGSPDNAYATIIEKPRLQDKAIATGSNPLRTEKHHERHDVKAGFKLRVTIRWYLRAMVRGGSELATEEARLAVFCYSVGPFLCWQGVKSGSRVIRRY